MEIRALASSSKGNAYWISDGQTPLLLECGISIKDIRRMLDFRLSDIAGCLVTHSHADHAKAVSDIMSSGVDVYTSKGTIEDLNLTGHRVIAVKALRQFKIRSWTILPFDTIHDASEPLGFLLANKVDKLLFITDSAYCRYRFEGLTHIMVECNHSLDLLNSSVESGYLAANVRDRIMKSHFSLDHLKDFLLANDLSKVQEIWLLHLSDGNSDAKRFKREIQELTGKMVFVAEQRKQL